MAAQINPGDVVRILSSNYRSLLSGDLGIVVQVETHGFNVTGLPGTDANRKRPNGLFFWPEWIKPCSCYNSPVMKAIRGEK